MFVPTPVIIPSPHQILPRRFFGPPRDSLAFFAPTHPPTHTPTYPHTHTLFLTSLSLARASTLAPLLPPSFLSPGHKVTEQHSTNPPRPRTPVPSQLLCTSLPSLSSPFPFAFLSAPRIRSLFVSLGPRLFPASHLDAPRRHSTRPRCTPPADPRADPSRADQELRGLSISGPVRPRVHHGSPQAASPLGARLAALRGPRLVARPRQPLGSPPQPP